MIRVAAILLWFTCACLHGMAQVNIITTIAGKDTSGISGDGGPATNSKLKAPFRIRPDKEGNIYIADALNHRIRKIDAATGIITTVVGSSPGFAGDGGAATDARLEVPQGVFVGGDNELYICDGINVRVRKVSFPGLIISTVAGNGTNGAGGDGGPATDAEFNQPAGVYVDLHNNIFIADWANKKVRKVDGATGIITTVAGNGGGGYSGDGGPATNSTIDGPIQVYCDNSGNLLIADQHNHRIRKVSSATGIITTIAGTGTQGFSGDGGLAKDAQLNQPAGLFVDKDDNIYVAEYGNGTVRRIDGSTGIISTVAGTGSKGFSGDGGPATNAQMFCSDVFVDKFGNLIIADYENHRIRKVSSGVAVNGIDKDVESKLYPNPTNGIFNVQTPVAISLVSIYNIGGVLVQEQTCIAAETQVDITAQPPGAYMVYVRCGEKMYVSKVVRN